MPVVSSALVKNTRLPQTTGLECPRPGTGVFQTMCSVSLQLRGALESRLTPLDCGPRHQGQLSGGTGQGVMVAAGLACSERTGWTDEVPKRAIC